MTLTASDGTGGVSRYSYLPSTTPQTPQESPSSPVVTTPARYTPEPSYHPQLLSYGPNQGPAAASGTFAEQVDGQQSQAVDLELMQIAEAAYDPNVTNVGNWTRVSDEALIAAGLEPNDFETPETGFRAGLYTDGNGNYVLAFSGSNATWQDWVDNNFSQGLGFFAEQYDQAPALAQLVADSAFGRDGNLVLTGHSLGGGLAATAALATNIPAVTYDASGVHDNTLERLGLDPDAARQVAEDGLIRRYNVDGDPLTAAQEDVPLLNRIPDAPGHEITLDDPLPPIPAPDLTDWPWVVAQNVYEYGQAKLERVADLHRQGTMIEALEEQRPWE